ncbi:MAG: hypothetical protein WCA77_02015, partial [Thermoplasmata archaeon]
AFRSMLLTDSNPATFHVLRTNSERFTTAGVSAQLHDARQPLDFGSFDFVDIDPFGSPLPFLPSAIASLRDPGLLGVAATDMPVLAGAARRAAERRYGGRPVRGRLGPEGGLRLVLANVARRAAEGGRVIRPSVCYIHDHHIRAYVRIQAGDPASAPIGIIEPGDWSGPMLDGEGPFGPMWLGPMFDPVIVRTLLVPPNAEHPAEARRFIERFRDEAEADRPFYYEPNTLAARLHLSHPVGPDVIIAALRSGGFSAGRTHARPAGFRTTAERSTVEEVVRDLSTVLRSRAP